MWRETRGLWTQKKVFRVRGRRREGEMKKGDIVEGGGCQSVLCPPPAYFPSGSSKRKVGENRKNLKGSRIFLPFSPSSPVFVFSCLCFSFFPFLLSSHISVKFSSRFRPASLTWGMSLYTLLLQPPPNPRLHRGPSPPCPGTLSFRLYTPGKGSCEFTVLVLLNTVHL